MAALRQGVMARRSYQAQRLGVLATDDAVGGVTDCPGRQSGHFERSGAAKRILLDASAAVDGKCLDFAHIAEVVNGSQLREAGRLPDGPAAAGVQAGSLQMPHHLHEPFGSLGMPARLVLHKRWARVE